MVRALAAARAAAVVLGLTGFAVSFAAAAGELPFHVLHRISLSGPSPVRALAFGPGGRHFYAAAADELRSYDAATGAPGPIVKLPGAAVGLAAAPRDGGVLYVATKAPARLLILSLRPLRITASVALRGGVPSALLYDGAGDALYAESRAGHSVMRLDPESGKTKARAHLRGQLEQMAANGRGMLYVANATANILDAIETSRMKRVGAIPLAGCRAPTGLAMDPVGRRLFVACGNGAALVVDEDMGFTFERLPIETARRLQAVFAFHPLGSGGWKAGAFIAGDGPALNGIQMKAFIRYVGGGSLPLAGRCTALAASSAAGRLVLALAGREGERIELLLIGGADAGGSQ